MTANSNRATSAKETGNKHKRPRPADAKPKGAIVKRGAAETRRPQVALPRTGPGSIKAALARYAGLVIKGEAAIGAAIPIVDGKVAYVDGWLGVAPMDRPAGPGQPAVVDKFAAVLRASQQIANTIIGPFNTAEAAATAFDALAPLVYVNNATPRPLNYATPGQPSGHRTALGYNGVTYHPEYERPWSAKCPSVSGVRRFNQQTDRDANHFATADEAAAEYNRRMRYHGLHGAPRSRGPCSRYSSIRALNSAAASSAVAKSFASLSLSLCLLRICFAPTLGNLALHGCTYCG